MNTAASLAVLRTAFIQAKLAEDAAKAARLEIESAILAHFPTDKLEGSITDADFGITVTFKVARKCDTARLQADWDKLSKNEQAAFKWAADVDTKTYKALAELDPTSYSTVTAYVTTTPNKPAITVKDIK